jgi:hypothetical protein
MTPTRLVDGAASPWRRRQFVTALPATLIGVPMLSACSSELESPASAAARIRRAPDFGEHAAAAGSGPGLGLGNELIRLATLAPSSHNTQCWKFAVGDVGITILPDLSRRCPAVDPDDHHLFVSLGCAAENLHHAALAHGLRAETRFDAGRDAIEVALTPTAPRRTALFEAITARQCTRGDYDGAPLSADELGLLERAGTMSGVRMLLLTERPAMEQVLEYIVQGNTAQMADPVFIGELKTWIRFNDAEALRSADGLYGVASGNPQIPGWIGRMAFRWLLTPEGENEKCVRQVRSSAGMAVFVGEAADKAHWVQVGRAYERFALQATALGIRNAFLNQPVEVAAVRAPFAAAMGLGMQRPDLVLRFGRGPTLPQSLRRPVQAVRA